MVSPPSPAELPDLEQLVATVLCPRFPLAIDGLDFGNGGDRPLPGGFCVFRADLPDSLEQIDLLRRQHGSPRRPYLCSDLERGAGQQIDGLTRLPPALALGAAGSEALAHAAGALTAREALAASIAVLFAPVLDVASDPDNPIVASRSFGANPREVARLGWAYVDGCIAEQAVPAAKHYPGHGATKVDSHIALPVVDRSLAELEALDELPFLEAIARGLPALMAGHLHVPALDAEVGSAATLSAAVLTRRLREQIGFRGVVFTDALDMGAVIPDTIRGPGDEPAVRALLAGADVALLPDDPHRAARNLVAAVESGLLPRLRLAQAARRIRERIDCVPVADHPRRVPDPLGEELALEIARKSVVRIDRPDRAAPLRFDNGHLDLVLIDDDEEQSNTALLLEHLERQRLLPKVTGPDRLRDGVPRLVVVCGGVHAGKGRVALDSPRARMLDTLLSEHPETGLLSIGPPQTITGLERAASTWFVFDHDSASLQAAAEALSGNLDATGQVCWVPHPGSAGSAGGPS